MSDRNSINCNIYIIMKKIHSTTKYKTQHFELTFGEDFIKPDESRYELELTLPPKAKKDRKQLFDLASKLISELDEIRVLCTKPETPPEPVLFKSQFYTITIIDVGPNPARVMAKLKEITGGSLKDCKTLMNKPSKDRMLANALPADQASKIKHKLEAVGATINLKMNTKSVYQTLIG